MTDLLQKPGRTPSLVHENAVVTCRDMGPFFGRTWMATGCDSHLEYMLHPAADQLLHEGKMIRIGRLFHDYPMAAITSLLPEYAPMNAEQVSLEIAFALEAVVASPLTDAAPGPGPHLPCVFIENPALDHMRQLIARWDRCLEEHPILPPEEQPPGLLAMVALVRSLACDDFWTKHRVRVEEAGIQRIRRGLTTFYDGRRHVVQVLAPDADLEAWAAFLAQNHLYDGNHMIVEAPPAPPAKRTFLFTSPAHAIMVDAYELEGATQQAIDKIRRAWWYTAIDVQLTAFPNDPPGTITAHHNGGHHEVIEVFTCGELGIPHAG